MLHTMKRKKVSRSMLLVETRLGSRFRSPKPIMAARPMPPVTVSIRSSRSCAILSAAAETKA